MPSISLSDVSLDDKVQLPSGGAIYLGDENTNGTWKIVRNGNNLSVYRRESGTYVRKSDIGIS